MNNYSSTYASVIAQALISIFAILKVDFPYKEDEITKAIAIIIAICVAVRALVGRYRAGGLKWNGFRLPEVKLSSLNALEPGEVVKFDDEE